MRLSCRLRPAKLSRCDTRLNFSTSNPIAADKFHQQREENKELFDLLTEGRHGSNVFTDVPNKDAVAETQRQAALSPSQQELPQSPLTDPRLTTARRRFKQPKAQAPKYGEPNNFRRKLARNPYAQALATPVRRCSLTGARLPSEFLISFGMVIDPRTGLPWQLPRFLVDKKTPAPGLDARTSEDIAQGKTLQENASPQGDHIQSTADVNMTPGESQETDNTPPAKDEQVTTPGPIRTGSSLNLLSSAQTMTYVADTRDAKPGRTIPMKRSESSLKGYRKPVWREDMSVFVLANLREMAFSRLGEVTEKLPEYVLPCDGWTALQEGKMPAGAVLWFPKVEQLWDDTSGKGTTAVDDEEGKRKKVVETSRPSDSQVQEVPSRNLQGEEHPSLYSMVSCGQKYIPIFNIPLLLGDDLAAQARKKLPVGNGPSCGLVVLRSKRRSMPLFRELWRLTGYIRDSSISTSDR